MDALGAMRSLANLQAKFQSESLLKFDPETLLALATGDIEGLSDAPISPTHDFHATFETASSAQLFDYRGEKVAGFEVNGVQMICLPQVYELFLKNMVGGLHTVYTKLKRLEISPLICNVEQVRALRGLGAIQPGVNRCKLIASSDFDKLYEDCTNTCTRPGRPPKRALPHSEDWTVPKKEPLSLDSSHLMNHQTGLPFSPPPGSTLFAEEMSQHLAVSNPLLLGNFLPQFTAHQLLVQHMMAIASQQKSLEVPQSSANVDESPPEGLSGDMGGEVSTPLNLTKTNSNSETCDSDSLENMRKVDASLSPSQYNPSDRGGSSSNDSNNSPSSETSAALNKIAAMIDMANDHFKQQKDAMQKEREELAELRTQLKDSLADENRLRHQLEAEKRRSSLYFRRYCKAKKEAIEMKEQLLTVPHVQM